MKRRALIASLAASSLLGTRFALGDRVDPKHRLGAFFAGWSELAPAKEWEEEKQKRAEILKALSELGYAENRNLVVYWRSFDMDFSRAAPMAAELVRLKVDVLLTTGTPQTNALRDATKTIPIVTSLGDPVASGFTRNLAKPEGNVTGLCQTHPGSFGKQIEMLRRVVPRLDRLMLIGDIRYTGMRELMQPLEASARAAGMMVEVRMVDRSGYRGVFADMKRLGIRAALINSPDIDMADVAGLAIQNGVATMLNGAPGYVELGGLMSYDPFHADLLQRTAVIVDKLFRGVKLADIPWELPDRTFLAVNLSTAKALGLTIPSDILLRADEIIQ
jgi:putative tryptophan/tyrosine transport system substrate-binding protein